MASIVCQISVVDFNNICDVPLLIFLVAVVYCLITAIENRVFFYWFVYIIESGIVIYIVKNDTIWYIFGILAVMITRYQLQCFP